MIALTLFVLTLCIFLHFFKLMTKHFDYCQIMCISYINIHLEKFMLFWKIYFINIFCRFIEITRTMRSINESEVWVEYNNIYISKFSFFAVNVWWLDYNYLCNQCLSPLEFVPRSLQGVLDTTLCDKVSQWPAIGQWFFPGTPVSSTK